MAPLPAPQRRASNSRPRARGRPRLNAAPAQKDASATIEVPIKKRKYIPGGPGGGGRYVEVDGTETVVGGSGPGGSKFSAVRPRTGRGSVSSGTPSRPRRERTATVRPRYSSAAAAAAAAVAHGDGYKPREERGWEEFHQDLDIDAKLPVFGADEIDGVEPTDTTADVATPERADGGSLDGFKGLSRQTSDMTLISPAPTVVGGEASTASLTNGEAPGTPTEKASATASPIKRRPGRPPRRHGSLLDGLGTPNGPKYIPPPGPNPRERLTLPKPSFRVADIFMPLEQKGSGQQNYVDRAMANVGYQESDLFMRPDKRLIRVAEGAVDEDLDVGVGYRSDGEPTAVLGGGSVGKVEYDMDEQDDKWLEAYNAYRKTEQVEAIKPAIFEVTMTKIEKEWHALEKRIPKPNPKPPQTHRPRSSLTVAINGEPSGMGEEQDSKCAVCDDGDCENTNAIVFCDGCDLAVHQECYGVPFIPEGQWLCRKCQLIGRGTPTCIFCPNMDGAFKQTNTSRWSHILCAIWIPEVSLGNTTFMEPVMDVEKVPKPRWKLTCYICRQRMGACIQCSNKNCFIAFHVTCARRARLFLRMKTAHAGPASMDPTVFKAYCDKHVPPDWRKENDVDAATADAQDFYRHTMRGRLWADSQQSALALLPSQSQSALPPADDLALLDPSQADSAGNKRKRNQPPKSIWKLPSGAPVVPSVVFNAVESSLQRFGIRKRKEYAAEACKYWTLKREARRGAALLKRLQLQMETFSSMEITRRNFAGMGTAGRPKLQRRIDFAEMLLQDVEKLRLLCDEVKKREREKLKDAEMLRDVVDTIYFPLIPLLWPIFDKAVSLDGKGVFRQGFSGIQSKLDDRSYTSVFRFAADLCSVLSAALWAYSPGQFAHEQSETAGQSAIVDPKSEAKDKQRVAKRIVRAIRGPLEEAIGKEADLGAKSAEKTLQELGSLLENCVIIRGETSATSAGDAGSDDEADEGTLVEKALTTQETNTDQVMADAPACPTSVEAAEQNHSGIYDEDAPGEEDDATVPSAQFHNRIEAAAEENGEKSGTREIVQPNGAPQSPPPTQTAQKSHEPVNGLPRQPETIPHQATRPIEPPTPATSSEEELMAPLNAGGIPWYLEPFDPLGTTIHEERWTGRDVARGMSEELSEIDDEELRGLVDEEMADIPESVPADGATASVKGTAQTAIVPRKNLRKRRWRGYR
ncbi:hypothetical protein L228DRAFT_280324 [Xylona heveae TC161]|uniref:PHD finger domain protein n=1 Tax=Xylona heveae (strain CBS 132557 / TC161) TaxID=1328760 RepID=A0A165IL41_XYLHT|nr:hypothetical protein L228DRAFT_280324 [Xylona heveae TC161]KZF25054.1 hypothetical protein L228DRAFT_280324 [Xylona heveae TC161]